MKYNYPIKYTAMPIIEQIGWSHGVNEIDRKYGAVCYIVSKCYLISDKTKYKENGQNSKEYEVVFPYQYENQYRVWKRVTPECNLFYHVYTNSSIVEEVFDSYEEALEFASKKNDKICQDSWIYLPFTDDIDKEIATKKREFNNKLARYKILEQQILINIPELESTNIKKLDELITINKNEIKTLSYNLYEYLSYDFNFIVYSISKEDYTKLIKAQEILDSQSIIDSANAILYHKSKEPVIIIDPSTPGTYFLDEDYGLCYSNEENELQWEELNKGDEEFLYLFTTETLEDIKSSFAKHPDIDLSKIKEPAKTYAKKRSNK